MVINSLSLEDINQKTPYKVWMSDKDRSFRFMSDAEIVLRNHHETTKSEIPYWQ